MTPTDTMCPDLIEPTFERHLDADWRSVALASEVRDGLSRRPRRLNPRWLYDDRGSELFDAITRLPEYYPTEAERSVLQREALNIAALTRADTLIELGSGTSDKTRTLLGALAATGRLDRFVPLDVSEQTLRDAAAELAERYAGLRVHGVVGDFTQHLAHLPTDGVPLLAFLGSTIGNLYPDERHEFLSSVAEWMPESGFLLLGVDLVKPLDRIMAAYNDSRGLTAEFTKNLLVVLNHELAADFDPSAFDHIAMWDPFNTRVDLRLRSRRDQRVAVPGAQLLLEIAIDEELEVEISTKFTLEQLRAELEAAGMSQLGQWSDGECDVALVLARRARPGG